MLVIKSMLGLCRTCGDDIDNFEFRNLFDTKGGNILEQIELVTGVWLEYDPNLPENMCVCCQQDLNTAIAFRERCVVAQRHFKQAQLNKEPIPDHLDPLNGEKITYKNSDFDINVLEEETEYVEAQVDEINIVDDISDIKLEAVIIENNINEVEDKSFEDNDDDADDNYVPEKTVRKKPLKKRGRKNISWKNLTEEEAKNLQREMRKRNCICDQCGRHFTDPSNLKLHLLRHSGIKNFQCNICSSKFYTSHLLRRHALLHTGIPLYSCEYCNRPFNNRKSKIEHERIHTNERPFSCAECDKSFRSKSRLKDHMVVHTRVRNFHCVVCDKWFLLRKNLNAHYRSKFHKQNELRIQADFEN